MKVTVVVENTVAFPFTPGIKPGLCGEHGLALMIDCAAGKWLYDTGRGKALLPNLETLGVSADEFDGIVLSHAHLDHFGALEAFLKMRSKPIDLYMHPKAFAKRYTRIGDGFRTVGIPWDLNQLSDLGANLHFTETAQQIADGLWVTGSIARHHAFEKITDNFYADGPDGEKIRDEIPDDQAMLLETTAGTVVLTGCAHAGVCNILDAAKAVLPNQPLRAVLGGLHLDGVSEERMRGTVEYLRRESLDVIAVGHCTGFGACCTLSAQFPDSFEPLHTGKVFTF